MASSPIKPRQKFTTEKSFFCEKQKKMEDRIEILKRSVTSIQLPLSNLFLCLPESLTASCSCLMRDDCHEQEDQFCVKPGNRIDGFKFESGTAAEPLPSVKQF
jgi:hypothetical protein